eukprot:762538-Hanusia_phi.AAC.2
MSRSAAFSAKFAVKTDLTTRGARRGGRGEEEKRQRSGKKVLTSCSWNALCLGLANVVASDVTEIYK